jgi:quercetin dioxygenase-like cupin family protein
MTERVLNVARLARFAPEKMAKTTLAESERLLLGLNCLEPGQSQAPHTHAGADKFYYVCTGRARFAVGGEVVEAATGDVVICPAGEPHGIESALERTTLLVGIAPFHAREK